MYKEKKRLLWNLEKMPLPPFIPGPRPAAATGAGPPLGFCAAHVRFANNKIHVNQRAKYLMIEERKRLNVEQRKEKDDENNNMDNNVMI